MTGKYSNFDELRQNEIEDEDYTISYREVDSKIAVIAPHGGGIEPGTVDIADATAGCDYTFYAFKGLKKTGNYRMHISSNAFDETLGLKAAQNAHISISIHGSHDKIEIVHIGGRNQDLKQEMLNALRSAGFNAVICEIPGLRGINPENICNRCKSGQGVQLEISRGLREKLFDNLDCGPIRKKTILFYKFVNILKGVLQKFERNI